MLLKKINSFILCLGLLGSLAGQAVTGAGGVSSSKNKVVCSKNKKIKDVKKPKISAPQKSQKKSPLKEDLQKFLSKHWEWFLLPPFVAVTAVSGYKLKKYLEKHTNVVKNKEKITSPKEEVKKEEESKVKDEEQKKSTKPTEKDVLNDQKAIDDSTTKNEISLESSENNGAFGDEGFWEKDITPLAYALDKYWVLYIVSKIYGKDSKTYEEVENFFNNTNPESFSKLKNFIRTICRANLVFSFIFAVLGIMRFIVKRRFCGDKSDGNAAQNVLELSFLIISPFSPTFGKVLGLAYGIAVGCKNAGSTASKVACGTFASLGGFVFGCGFPIFLKYKK